MCLQAIGRHAITPFVLGTRQELIGTTRQFIGPLATPGISRNKWSFPDRLPDRDNNPDHTHWPIERQARWHKARGPQQFLESGTR